MALGDPRIMTAGSQVADTLQGILQRKRETERQAMLDALASKEQASVEAERLSQAAARQAETERLGKQATAQIAESGERIFQSKLGDVRRGTTAENIKDAALREQMMNRGLMETKGIQGPTMSGEGDLGSISSYRGTAKEEQDDTQKMLMQEVAARYPDMPGLDVLAAGGPAIPGMLQRRVNPVVFDPDTHKSFTVPDVQVPENDAFHVSPSSPIGGSGGAAANKPVNYRVFDEVTGQDIGGVPLAPAQMAQWYEANPGRSLRPAGFKPPTDPQVAAGLRTQVTKIKGDLALSEQNDQNINPIAKFFGSKPEESAATKALKEQYATAVGQLVAADTSTPERVKEAAFTILSQPELAGLPLSQILSEVDLTEPDGVTPLNPPLSTQEIQELGRSLAAYGGIDLSGGQK